MYIIKSGRLESISSNGQEVEPLAEGSTFGELSILKVVNNSSRSNRRVRSLRSVGYCEVYVLKQEDVLHVLCDYPEARKKLVEKARKMIRERDKITVGRGNLAEDYQQVVGSRTLTETLESLALVMKEMDKELDRLYDSFEVSQIRPHLLADRFRRAA